MFLCWSLIFADMQIVIIEVFVIESAACCEIRDAYDNLRKKEKVSL